MATGRILLMIVQLLFNDVFEFVLIRARYCEVCVTFIVANLKLGEICNHAFTAIHVPAEFLNHNRVNVLRQPFISADVGFVRYGVNADEFFQHAESANTQGFDGCHGVLIGVKDACVLDIPRPFHISGQVLLFGRIPGNIADHVHFSIPSNLGVEAVKLFFGHSLDPNRAVILDFNRTLGHVDGPVAISPPDHPAAHGNNITLSGLARQVWIADRVLPERAIFRNRVTKVVKADANDGNHISEGIQLNPTEFGGRFLIGGERLRRPYIVGPVPFTVNGTPERAPLPLADDVDWIHSSITITEVDRRTLKIIPSSRLIIASVSRNQRASFSVRKIWASFESLVHCWDSSSSFFDWKYSRCSGS
nr:MAG TPA: hypothetical protein [Caudoviricetes sp.]